MPLDQTTGRGRYSYGSWIGLSKSTSRSEAVLLERGTSARRLDGIILELGSRGLGRSSRQLRYSIRTRGGHPRSKFLDGVVSPPTGPSLAILDAMIDPYFATVNLKFPIWDKSKFQAMVDSLRQIPLARSPDGRVTSAATAWFFSPCMQTRFVRFSGKWRSPESGVTKSVSSLDSDLVAGFLANSKHAQCCREPRTALSVPSQRTGTLVTDKKICWSAGVSPRIPAGVQLNFAAQDTDKAFEALSLQAELAEIEDIIYRKLYALDRVSNRRRGSATRCANMAAS
ncbi:hypothetical protein E4U09_003546 [Claviceps aff. purpurea]|uniref:Uncharacterized protein n=1 Tax=Claviceps aff. purpurea TaxID=1967640 RepID=A0A9P7QE99_9HYPO|nr:hypothetical protein E4U09_003546 [Claviceps aff. purpurea]